MKNMSKKKIKVIRIISILLISVLYVLELPGAEKKHEAPVWTFDFRDTFYDIAFLNRNKAVIVGFRGRILVTHGKYKNLWSPRDSKTGETLTCLSFVDGKNGWAAGHGGVIIHTSDGGETWEVQRKGSPQNLALFDIKFVSKNIGYVCGAYDTLLKTTDGGKSWDDIATGLDNIYNGLCFRDENNGFLAGEFGTLLKTADGGKSWKRLNIGPYEGTLFGVISLSTKKILAYGISGKLIISYDGGIKWKDISPGTKEPLFRAAYNGDDVIVVGRSGVMLLSKDGAKSFVVNYDKENNTIAGVCSHPEGGFTCVGEFCKIDRIEAIENDFEPTINKFRAGCFFHL